jgi:hypothetical protein
MASVVPHDAVSDTLEKHVRGKCIGYRKPDGKWVGKSSKKFGPMAEWRMTAEDVATAEETGAYIGILGRNYPAIDIDVEDRALADEIEKLAIATLGPAPVRMREGSARRLLMYSGAGLSKKQWKFRPPGVDPNAKPWAVELLATDNYYNVSGIHPSGKPYYWRDEHPCEISPYDLTAIDADGVERFRAALKSLLEEARHSHSHRHNELETRTSRYRDRPS